jgi:uncharacterized metal-binding protein YceD (DUF177 family)
MNNAPVPEFSRVITIARISQKGTEERLEAKPAERAALAERFDLIEIPALKAEIMLIQGPQQTIAATGLIEAEVIQRCVVTLEPISSRLAIDVDVTFAPQEANLNIDKAFKEMGLDDDFEFFSGGKIDIGELVAQQLGVSIDPYPRKANAALVVAEFGGKDEKRRPFAKLSAALKSKKNKDKRSK